MDKNKKRAHHLSAPINNNLYFGYNISESTFEDAPPPAYQPTQNIQPYDSKHTFYHPTPAPQTVVIHRQPTRSKDACCWGCLAALCLCFGAKECC